MLESPPPEVLASWPTPNYIDPPRRGLSAIIIGSVGLALLLFTVHLRFYTQIRITRNFGVDDIFLGFGVIFALVFTGLIFHAELAGLWDRHIWDVPPENISLAIKFTLVAQLIYLVGSTFVKLSFLFLYRRVLCHSIWKHYNRVLNAIIAVVILVPCFYIPLIIFQCRPIRAFWEVHPDYEYYCLPKPLPDGSVTIVSVVLDFVVVMLPIPTLWRSGLPLKQRIGMCCLFAVGLLIICVAGSLRSYYLIYVMFDTWDSTWYVTDVYVATMIELYVGIICASVPTLRPLAAKYWPVLSKKSKCLLPYHTKGLFSGASRSGLSSRVFSQPRLGDGSTSQSLEEGELDLSRPSDVRKPAMKRAWSTNSWIWKGSNLRC